MPGLEDAKMQEIFPGCQCWDKHQDRECFSADEDYDDECSGLRGRKCNTFPGCKWDKQERECFSADDDEEDECSSLLMKGRKCKRFPGCKCWLKEERECISI